MNITPEMILHALELIIVPLFLWMDHRVSKAEADAMQARAKASSAFEIAKEAQDAIAVLRSEQAKLTADVLGRMESLNVALARIDGRLQAFLEFEKERRAVNV